MPCNLDEFPKENIIIFKNGRIVSSKGFLDTSDIMLGEKAHQNDIAYIRLKTSDGRLTSMKQIDLRKTPGGQEVWIEENRHRGATFDMLGKLLRAHLAAAVEDLIQTFPT